MPTILIVDDEHDLLIAFQAVLRHEGYDVVTASTAAQALQVFDTAHPDLVLLDIKLGNRDQTDGLTLLRQLRARRPDLKVVVVSAYLDFITRQEAMDAGAIDCWAKPVSMPMLQERTAEALAHPPMPPPVGTGQALESPATHPTETCTFAELVFPSLRAPWPPCAGSVTAVSVSPERERVRTRAAWKMLQRIGDEGSRPRLCAKHIARLRDEGRTIRIEEPGAA